ncbi:MAG TPA: hypothetical protein VJ242_04585 [Patescibacteria group bacterium]|nr:hypothetical protein [Patescibacteria group bacterium]
MSLESFGNSKLFWSPIDSIGIAKPKEINQALRATGKKTPKREKKSHDERKNAARQIVDLLKKGEIVTVNIVKEDQLAAVSYRTSLQQTVKKLMPNSELHTYFSSSEGSTTHKIVFSTENLRENR